MNLLLLLLASYGVCFGLMNDKATVLTVPLRRIPLFKDEEGRTFFDRMFACPYCTGFHTGWLVFGLYHATPFEAYPHEMWFSMLLFAFASSAFCYGLDTVLVRVEVGE